MEIRILNEKTKECIYSYKNNLNVQNINTAYFNLNLNEILFYNIYDIINNKKKMCIDYKEAMTFTNSFLDLVYKLKKESQFVDSARREFIKYYNKIYKKKNKELNSCGLMSIYATNEYVSYIKKIRKKSKTKQLNEIESFFYSNYEKRYYFFRNLPTRHWLNIDISWSIEDRIYNSYYFLDLFINNLLFIYEKRISNSYTLEEITKDEKDFMLFLYDFEYYFFNQLFFFYKLEEFTTISEIDNIFGLILNTLNNVLNINLTNDFLSYKNGLEQNINDPFLQYILFTYFQLVNNLTQNNYINIQLGYIVEEKSNILMSSILFDINKLNKIIDGVIYLNRNITFSINLFKPLPLGFSTKYFSYYTNDITNVH